MEHIACFIVAGVLAMLSVSVLLLCRKMRTQRDLAKQRDKEKGIYLANMSHEMRTQLNVIIGMVQIAYKADELEKMRACVQTVERSSKQLLAIVNNVLDISKIEAGKLELNRAPFSLQKVVEQTCDLIQGQLKQNDLSFKLTFAQGLKKHYLGDEMRIAQIISNLLSNAIKFTPHGGYVHVSVGEGECRGERPGVIIKVQDNGIGMNAEEIKRVFDPFVQADSSVANLYGGTGLGLTICKTLAELMGGRIDVVSEPKMGTTFSVFLQLEDPGTQLGFVASNISTGAVNMQGIKILLAEDIAINRDIFVALLGDSGVQVDTAQNGREAAQLYAQDPHGYHLIVMDVQMPVMNGLEATRLIREMPFDNAKTIPIIALSAGVFKEDVDECMKAGMNDHLAKPIRESVLIEMIAKYI